MKKKVRKRLCRKLATKRKFWEKEVHYPWEKELRSKVKNDFGIELGHTFELVHQPSEEERKFQLENESKNGNQFNFRVEPEESNLDIQDEWDSQSEDEKNKEQNVLNNWDSIIRDFEAIIDEILKKIDDNSKQ